jgi:hypothetical protein
MVGADRRSCTVLTLARRREDERGSFTRWDLPRISPSTQATPGTLTGTPSEATIRRHSHVADQAVAAWSGA